MIKRPSNNYTNIKTDIASHLPRLPIYRLRIANRILKWNTVNNRKKWRVQKSKYQTLFAYTQWYLWYGSRLITSHKSSLSNADQDKIVKDINVSHVYACIIWFVTSELYVNKY